MNGGPSGQKADRVRACWSCGAAAAAYEDRPGTGPDQSATRMDRITDLLSELLILSLPASSSEIRLGGHRERVSLYYWK